MDYFLPRLKQAAVLLFFFLLITPVNSVFGDDLQWAVTGNILYFPAENGVDADPAPIIPSLGGALSLPLPFAGFLRVEFTEDIYITNYEFNSALGYPTACNPENRSALVIGFITAVQVTGNFSIDDKGTVLRAYAGPAADLRIVALAAGLNHSSDSDAKEQTNAIRDYFSKDARWLLPVVGVGMDFPINEKFLLGFDLRMWFPIYKAWTDKDLPEINGWRFGVGFRITPRSN
jgi:hypothetical protein